MQQRGESEGYKLVEGALVGEYKLIQFLDAGGMGQVWLAAMPRIDKKAVIKAVLPELRQVSKAIEYFKAEGAIGARLHHGNIVNMIDRGPGYLVFEYVEGVTLRRLLDAGSRLPADWSVYIASELFKALHYLHTARIDGKPAEIVHRDISPGNIFITPAGEVKLGDLGIAQLAGGLQIREQTVIPTIKGKLKYVSPEMAEGAPVDQRADLFQVGLIIYECLTGSPAFDGTRAGTENIIQGKYRHIPTLVDDVPPAVVAVTERLMARDSADRPSTAALARKLVEESCPTFYRAGDEADPNSLVGAVLRLADLRSSSTFHVNEHMKAMLGTAISASAPKSETEKTAPGKLEARPIPSSAPKKVIVQATPEDRTLVEDDDPPPKPTTSPPASVANVPHIIDTDPEATAPISDRVLGRALLVPQRQAGDGRHIEDRKAKRRASPQGNHAYVLSDASRPASRGSRYALPVVIGLLLAGAVGSVAFVVRSRGQQRPETIRPPSSTSPSGVATAATLPPAAPSANAPAPTLNAPASPMAKAEPLPIPALPARPPASTKPQAADEKVGMIIIRRENEPMRVRIDGLSFIPPLKYEAEPGRHEVVIVRGEKPNEQEERSIVNVSAGHHYTINRK